MGVGASKAVVGDLGRVGVGCVGWLIRWLDASVLEGRDVAVAGSASLVLVSGAELLRPDVRATLFTDEHDNDA